MQQDFEIVIEGVPVTIKHGDITKENADALVNLTNSSLNHYYGVSKAILEAGGAPLQEECRRLGTQIHGDVVVTDAGNIKCKKIVHAIGANELSKIPNAVKKVLEECDKMLLVSVAFPAIGTGVSRVDPQESLKSILKGIKEHLSGTRSSLQRISIITFTPNVYYEYLKVVKAESEKNINLRLILNGTIVELIKGDITKQPVDCILNLTNSTMTWNLGVSGAILSAAGPLVAYECAQFGPLTTNEVVVTTGGNLMCKHIMHIKSPKSVPAFAPSLETILMESKAKSFKTIAIPAIGTGNIGITPEASIEAILDGLERSLTKMNAAEFTKILILAYDEHVYSAFTKAFQAKQMDLNLRLTLNGNIVELVKGDITKQPVDCILNLTNSTMTWNIGVSGAILSAAGPLVAYECAQFGPLTTNEVVVTTGGNLMCKHIMHIISPTSVPAFAPVLENILLESKAKSFKTIALPAIGTGNIGIKPEASIEAILDGLGRSLSNMNAAEFTKILIIAYDEHIYSAFARAFQARQKRLTLSKRSTDEPVDLNNVKRVPIPTPLNRYIEILKLFTTAEQNLSTNVTEQRNTLPSPPKESNVQTSTELQPGKINDKRLHAYLTEPGKWSPMEGQVYKEVELHKNSAEFKIVADGFYKSAKNPPYQISKITRIQNVGLWQKYGFIKFTVDQKYPAQENEKRLYHGTDDKTAEKINMHGFNRSFCGKNATAYGKGTYFATNASYSCQDRFSVEDDNGEKHVYQAAVITGKCCLSHKSYVEPPPTVEDPKMLYNTTVDNLNNPQIFVVYSDYCAYPEYLISFTSSN